MLAELGFEGITMEALAARAGVGKATIYRRWKKKTDVLIDAVMRVTEPAVLVDTGDLRADLLAMTEGLRLRLASSVAGRIMPCLLGAAIDDSELMTVYWNTAVRPRRELFVERVRRAEERGEIRAGLDYQVLCDLCFSPIVYRRLFLAVRPPATKSDIDKSIDILLSGALPA